MSNKDCGCGNSSPNELNQAVQQQVTLLQEDMTCTRVFSETVTEAAELIITPRITPGPTSTHCVGEPRIRRNFPTVQPDCTFTVLQDVCAQFEVTFGAHAEIGNSGLICGTPGTGPCPPPPTITCCLAVDESNMSTEVTTVASLLEIPLVITGASFSIMICSPNCELGGSHFSLQLQSTPVDVRFEINHTEITEMSCDNGNLSLTAVGTLRIGNTQLPNVTFNILITPTSFSVTALSGSDTIFTSTSTVVGTDRITLTPCEE